MRTRVAWRVLVMGLNRRLFGARTRLIVGLVVAVISLGTSSGAQAAWWPFPYVAPRAAPLPPDQTWLNDVPRSGASKPKVAVFVIQGDDVYQPVREAVVRSLRRKGLDVTAALRPVDSPAQYREMSSTLKVAAYVDGEVTGEGAHHNAHIRIRSGVTGQHVAVANFSGPTPKMVGGITRSLWNKVGSATMRACSATAHSHRREREPLRIEAGTPLDDASIATPGT
jgi:hypothetical protein